MRAAPDKSKEVTTSKPKGRRYEIEAPDESEGAPDELKTDA